MQFCLPGNFVKVSDRDTNGTEWGCSSVGENNFLIRKNNFHISLGVPYKESEQFVNYCHKNKYQQTLTTYGSLRVKLRCLHESSYFSQFRTLGIFRFQDKDKEKHFWPDNCNGKRHNFTSVHKIYKFSYSKLPGISFMCDSCNLQS